jgi:hypothetical protein
MKQYPIIINVRDRVSHLTLLVAWLEAHGQENIWLCDNASTYPPLVEYLKASPHHVRYNDINLGHRAPWLSGLVFELGHNTPFIVTDPDVVPSEDCPSDVFDVFERALNTHRDIDKVGFSLRIDDLPPHYAHADAVVKWETQWWRNERFPGFYFSPIDTTFAMYRPGEGHLNHKSLRTAPPYSARHMPWYENSSLHDEEREYYLAHADSLVVNWDAKVLPANLRAQLIQMRNRISASNAR